MPASTAASGPAVVALPPITPASSKGAYGRLLREMLPYHNSFRATYASIMSLLSDPATQHGQAISLQEVSSMLNSAHGLCRHLEVHHHIEETYIFPVLAKKMPSFDHDSQHTHEHELMHNALETYAKYIQSILNAFNSGPGRKALSEGCGQPLSSTSAERKPWPESLFSATKFKQLTETLGGVLFPHLKAEEESLAADNMRNVGWTIEELEKIPM